MLRSAGSVGGEAAHGHRLGIGIGHHLTVAQVNPSVRVSGGAAIPPWRECAWGRGAAGALIRTLETLWRRADLESVGGPCDHGGVSAQPAAPIPVPDPRELYVADPPAAPDVELTPPISNPGDSTVPAWLAADPRVRHRHHRPATPGVTAPFPSWVSVAVRDALASRGVRALWRHQVEAAESVFDGRHTAISTGTASGKSLAYLLPIIAATAESRVGFATTTRSPLLQHRRAHTALYLAPTKALAHDQLRAASLLGPSSWKATTLDGDSELAERRFARDFASFVLSNPDMLHRSLLPQHERWATFLGALRFVVIDEAHRYRGLFGAHVAQVLRRLRRLCRRYGSDPIFISASATVGEPAALLASLAGVTEVTAIETDHSARPPLDFLIWQPQEDPHRETSTLLAQLVAEDRQTLAFTSSRVQAELVAERAKRRVENPRCIASYRAGYLAADRRTLEQSLQTGELIGVACTNALELGVDIAGVDAVISCGFPGTVAALWQQAGRAGRSSRPALAMLVARPDPLDAYLCSHPELIFGAPIEATVLHPDNPHVLSAHLAAAAQEMPLTARDAEFFGPETISLADRLARNGVLRQRGPSWYWTRPDRAVDAIELRTIGSGAVAVVDQDSGRVIGQVDPAAVDRTVHQGAVYLHQGEQWLVTSLDEGAKVALCTRTTPGYFTQAQSNSDLRIVCEERSRRLGAATVSLGRVEFSSQVNSFLRRDEVSGAVWDSTPLDRPLRSYLTRAVWWTLDDLSLATCGVEAADLAGAAHAAEHAAIGMLPALAPCDRWDIGGLSTTLHPDTGQLTVFVHDGLPGGAGFADRAFEQVSPWLAATLRRLEDCDCEAGCPRCVVSPKCGNGNRPLDKAGAVNLLKLLVS